MPSIDYCRVCDGSDFSPVVDLGHQPWCNHFLTESEVGHEPHYPLRVVFCNRCATSQLDFTVPKEVMFGDHTYLSGITQSLSAHFEQVAREIDERFFQGVEGRSVLDIGSNDGTQLTHFQGLGYDVLGVESSVSTAKIAQDRGIETVNAFFDRPLVESLGRKFHVINAAGVFFHLEELHSVCEGIHAALRDDGVFVVQFLYMKSIMDNCAFDQIYHEHLLYYTLQTIETLLNRHNLSMFDAYLSPIHGGSIVGYVGHAGRAEPTDNLKRMRQAENEAGVNTRQAYLDFARRIERMKEQNLAYLNAAKAAGKTIHGFGAPVKGNTMLNYFGVDRRHLDVLVEKNPLRKGLYSPGSHIPIVMEDELERQPDINYVLAWNFKKEILANNQHLIDAGVEFYFPVDPDRTAEAL